MANPQDAAEITSTAVSVGSVSQAASDAVERAVRSTKEDTGISVSEIRGARVFLVQVEIDDSGSMKGFETPVRSAFRKLKNELLEAERDAEGLEILISVTMINRGLIQPFCRITECIDLDDNNHVCDGETPFYSRTLGLFGTLVAKVAELAQSGRTAQTFTALISDGQPTDGPGGNSRVRVEPGTLRQVVLGLTETRQHIVCGVSIGQAANDTFGQVGIKGKWILDPSKDGYAFDAAIREVSRASRSASKGAGAFQSVANEGFR